MTIRNFFTRAFAGLLLLTFAALAAGCNDNDNNDNNGGNGGKDAVTLTVAPNALELGAEAGATATFTITTNAAWTATITGEGFTLGKTSGTGDAAVSVTASAANTDSEPAALGSVTIKAEGFDGTKSVGISQLNSPKPAPAPGDVTIVVDFAQGPGIATPALPSSSENALTGRHEYTIKGRSFAIHADAQDGGKFFWTDNSQYFDAPEPCKGLFFSKIGAYVEFPVVAGKALTTIGYAFNNGAGKLPKMDITTPDNDLVDYMLDYADDQTGMTYTLLNPGVNVTYRLTVLSRENAQVSKFVLVYAEGEK